MIDISIVIPVYFNEGSIIKTYKKLETEVFSEHPTLNFELIIVDDGSEDNSFAEICTIKEHITISHQIIQFTKNFGQVAAIYAGYQAAKGKGVLNIAADLQEPATLINEMIKSFLLEEAEIIAGQRIGRKDSVTSKVSSRIFYWMMKKLNFSQMPLGGFDIVLINNRVKKVLLDMKESNPFWQGQLLWTGFNVKFIPYKRLEREVGTSRWSFSKKMKYLLDGILNYSYAPLRFFSFLGLISFILGMIYAGIILIQYFNGGDPFTGWTPIMIVILLFSGLQLLTVGVIGEYLWRTLEQSKQRPMYLIKNKIDA